MKTQSSLQLKKRTRKLIITFIIFLVLSGITAFPLQSELSFLTAHMSLLPEVLQQWIMKMYLEIINVNSIYPQLSYGTDWLAFAHIVIATVFIGPLIDPVKNVWVIQFGMIACVMVFPLALLAGPIRHIPFYWQLIDCSFGVFGFIPLYSCYKNIQQFQRFTSN